MTIGQVQQTLAWLKAMFPMTSKEECEFIADRLLPLEFGPVDRVLRSYAETHEELNRPELLRLIQAAHQQSCGAPARQMTDWERTDLEHLEMMEGLSDEELATRMKAVIESLPANDSGRRYWIDAPPSDLRNPKKMGSFRYLVCRALRKERRETVAENNGEGALHRNIATPPGPRQPVRA
jgi:hypothetical protein